MTKTEQLLLLPQKIFTVQDLGVIWSISDKVQLWNTIRYYLRTGKLHRIHKGLYAVKPHTSFEVAQKLVSPSYISFYSALAAHGIIFQLYTTVHSMALVSKRIQVQNESYAFHQLKEQAFFDPYGIEDSGTYRIAGPERAVCDSLYLVPGLAFDDLSQVNFTVLRTLAKLYQNQRLELEVAALIESQGHHA